jgi:hypothetical protein|tara:strand:- start:15222 stop:15683 length:462 start_codon:yes stop_codon:yes gene_type:complete
MPAGRPRTSTPPPEEMILLGEEMLKWIENNNPIHLSQWWSIEKFIDSKVWRNMIEASEFSPYYTKALKMIGMNYISKDSCVEPRIKDRWQRVYFKDLKNEEDETARFLQSLRIEELEKLPTDVLDKFTALMAQMKHNQSSNSDLTSKSAETKS